MECSLFVATRLTRVREWPTASLLAWLRTCTASGRYSACASQMKDLLTSSAACLKGHWVEAMQRRCEQWNARSVLPHTLHVNECILQYGQDVHGMVHVNDKLHDDLARGTFADSLKTNKQTPPETLRSCSAAWCPSIQRRYPSGQLHSQHSVLAHCGTRWRRRPRGLLRILVGSSELNCKTVSNECQHHHLLAVREARIWPGSRA
jgi:hypothetical protein